MTRYLRDPGRRLLFLSIGVFFIGGFLTSLVSLLVPQMTLIFGLDYARALLVQAAFHSSYLLFAMPIAWVIIRLGYMRAVASGLAIMAVACSVFLWAFGLRSYEMMLLSVLTLSIGMTFLQIAGNTMVTVAGDPSQAVFRLNLLQGFNSIGTVAGPLAGAQYMLGAQTSGPGSNLAPPFLFAVLLLAVLSATYMLHCNLLGEAVTKRAEATAFTWGALLADRRLMGGVVAIFVYVGAEVTIGALLTNFLMKPDILSLDAVTAGRMVSLYWGGAMVGRVAGAFMTRWIRPSLLLMFAALGGGGLTLVAVNGNGMPAAFALLAVGLCNSIMYPTIFALALPRSPVLATPAAMLLCMAVVGGAIMPMLTGALADFASLSFSLLVPAFCYALIALFANIVRKEQLL